MCDGAAPAASAPVDVPPDNDDDDDIIVVDEVIAPPVHAYGCDEVGVLEKIWDYCR